MSEALETVLSNWLGVSETVIVVITLVILLWKALVKIKPFEISLEQVRENNKKKKAQKYLEKHKVIIDKIDGVQTSLNDYKVDDAKYKVTQLRQAIIAYSKNIETQYAQETVECTKDQFIVFEQLVDEYTQYSEDYEIHNGYIEDAVCRVNNIHELKFGRPLFSTEEIEEIHDKLVQ